MAAVGEGLAAGVIFTIPALFFLGTRPQPGYIFMLSMIGGILGILFMIPLRRYIIVKEHGILPFPEGTACAEILKAGAAKAASATSALWGLIVGSLYKLCIDAFFSLERSCPSCHQTLSANLLQHGLYTCTFRCGLHHWPQNCSYHVCRRCYRLVGTDSID